ncbi:hypothetical protein HK098_005845 [Nowakowskiella sp. JEL0407]|nr:hypothetical protein HK098_005845 [Nowakowskiella sp. JEL0407]
MSQLSSPLTIPINPSNHPTPNLNQPKQPPDQKFLSLQKQFLTSCTYSNHNLIYILLHSSIFLKTQKIISPRIDYYYENCNVDKSFFVKLRKLTTVWAGVIGDSLDGACGVHEAMAALAEQDGDVLDRRKAVFAIFK